MGDTQSRRKRLKQEEEKKKANSFHFEEVSADEEWSTDDETAVAETLAMGREMLSKKKKQKMIDNSYNRFAFDDPDNLPRWFVEEERAHNQPVLPITKEQVNEFKAYLKSVN